MIRKLIWLPLVALFMVLLLNSSYARQQSLGAVSQMMNEDREGTKDYISCDTPSTQPRYIGITTIKADSARGSFEPVADANSYLVVVSTSRNPGFVPATGTSYTVGSTVGNSKIVQVGSGNNFIASGLSAGTDYYVYVFSMKSGCPGGTVYRSYNPAVVLMHTKSPSGGGL